MYVKKAMRAQTTKARLERTAREFFAERGFAGVSAEELVAKAEVTRGALYHHYDGKEGLFAAVVEAMMVEVHQGLATKAQGASNPLQGLERGIQAFLNICTKPGVQRILLIDAPTVLGWQAWRAMDVRYGLGLLKQALSGAMSAGLLRKLDVDVTAHLLLGALIEAAMIIAHAPEPTAAHKAVEKSLAAMISGWRAPAG